SLFDEEAFVVQLGQFLNNYNFLGQNDSPAHVDVRSLSIDKQSVEDISKQLNQHTYNIVYVPEDFSALALPIVEELERGFPSLSRDKHIFKVNVRQNEIEAKHPEHFSFTPPQFYRWNRGQWAIDLVVERHNNLSRFVNVTDTWSLPRRINATRCFTKCSSKVSKNNLLTLIPSNEDFPFPSTSLQQKLWYELY